MGVDGIGPAREKVEWIVNLSPETSPLARPIVDQLRSVAAKYDAERQAMHALEHVPVALAYHNGYADGLRHAANLVAMYLTALETGQPAEREVSK